ncbi:unnamed protein product [Lasius platythorax]|uniref:Uncharacterized protein n=1 Tax=Lasius platythorax TaxID=488582 RepID=A0AAV2P0G5_9HYME
MDDYSKELLKSWDLDILIKHFEENCIDKDSMANLTSDLIKELIPQVGLRIKFNKKWQEHFNKIEDVTTKQDESTNLNTTHNITYSSDEEISNERDNNENLVDKENCFVGSSVFRKLQRPSVKNILKLTAQGRAILKSYERHKILNRKCRSNIVDLILSEILNKIHGSLKNEDFDSLSKEIEELFPTETSSTCYVPPIAKKYSRNNKSITSRGKLVDKYRNKIRDYRKLTGCNLTECSSTSTSTPYNSELEDDSTIRESVLWLQNNLSPWQLVESHWKSTLAYRRNEIQSSQNKSIAEIFSQWPVLKHPTAYTLIDEDFRLQIRE